MTDRAGVIEPAGRRSRVVPRGGIGVHVGYWAVAFAFLATMVYASAPSPLYVLYQQRDGFGPLLVTVVFAVYAVGVLASLLLLGHVSDWVGRRRVMCAALLLDAASVLAFVLWRDLAGLLVGRVLCGVATGMITATATAYLVELRRAGRAGRRDGRADVVATAANVGGMGVGPLMAGLLAAWLPNPLRLPYLVCCALLLLAATLVALTPETVAPVRPRPAYRPQRVVVPRASHARFVSAAASAFVCFAVFSVFTAIGPGFLAHSLGETSHALAGACVFATFATAAVAQIALASLGALRLARLGQSLAATGIVLLVGALWLLSLACFFAAAVVAGVGCGVLFKGCITTVNEIAPADARAEALAGLFVAAYTGTAVPTVALGLATQTLPAKVALLVFAVPMLALIAIPGRRLRQPEAAAVPVPCASPSR